MVSTIRTKARPSCPVCGETGQPLYKKLTDKLFQSPGNWGMNICPNTACKTLWLDPAPIEEDIPKLYQVYSTHTDEEPVTVPTKNRKKLFDYIRDPYLYKRYGYPPKPSSFFQKALGLLAYTHPAWRDTQDANLFYLPALPQGRLLDVGCGSGSALSILEKRGWIGTGVDFDELAIKNAKRKGLDVYVGDIFSQAFPDEHFDAIIMNHVIEHVPNPREVVIECRRVLKKGGTLVVMTPNSASRGHTIYKHNWRGLETPTHLQIFSVASLGALAHQAGFINVKNFSSTQGVRYILDASKAMLKTSSFTVYHNHTLPGRIFEQFRWFILGWKHVLFPGRDEVAAIICKK